MMNIFVLRKILAINFGPLIAIIIYAGSSLFYVTPFKPILYSLAFVVIWSFVGNALVKHPFRDVVEGKGLLAVDINSTGRLGLFLLKFDLPLIFGNYMGKDVKAFYDRKGVVYLNPPVEAGKIIRKKDDINIRLDKDSFNKARFQMGEIPAILYNSMMGCVIDKDMLSENEKSAFAEHHVTYLNRRVESLSVDIKNFARHVVETTKSPLSGLLANKWTWIIIVIALIIAAVIFGPMLLNTMGQTFGGVQSNVADAITPR